MKTHLIVFLLWMSQGKCQEEPEGESEFVNKNVLIVSLNDTCRGPMAAGILAQLAKQRGWNFRADSAGLTDLHLGEPPDRRVIETLQNHEIELSFKNHTARLFTENDFDEYDIILATSPDVHDVLQELDPLEGYAFVWLLPPYDENNKDLTVYDIYSSANFEDFENFYERCVVSVTRFLDFFVQEATPEPETLQDMNSSFY